MPTAYLFKQEFYINGKLEQTRYVYQIGEYKRRKSELKDLAISLTNINYKEIIIKNLREEDKEMKMDKHRLFIIDCLTPKEYKKFGKLVNKLMKKD